MKLVATREAPVSEVSPGESITHDAKRWMIDEVRRTREGFSLFVIWDESMSTRRTTLTFGGDEKVTIEAGEADRRKLLEAIQLLLAGDQHTAVPGVDKFEYDAKAGTLSLVLSVWTVTLEA